MARGRTAERRHAEPLTRPANSARAAARLLYGAPAAPRSVPPTERDALFVCYRSPTFLHAAASHAFR
ncbi:hypothetical protein DB771_03670 [Burkholderia sp. AU29985]|nr:hypothetical protein XM57_16930 [Burkholderia cepacia]AYZ96411.1 hypothetical protein EGY28_14720 [Burkholderia dolosa]ETP66901.1 hypothetical protein BDSB_13520 [Burkholderia dolosa PC543]PRE57502.1 hypothetical protein C6P87_00830 [Burkholderia sp. AU12872]PUA78403.1 hypothetical protein DB771_03670 [Burkholderia sp. AU29985]